MKVSVPHIPKAVLEAAVVSPGTLGSLEAAIRQVADFIRPGNLTVLTGAGVSVDSGIRAYRGHNGSYMNPNYR
jgi:NAD+-dependent protein deacetylase sirtuin 4